MYHTASDVLCNKLTTLHNIPQVIGSNTHVHMKTRSSIPVHMKTRSSIPVHMKTRSSIHVHMKTRRASLSKFNALIKVAHITNTEK